MERLNGVSTGFRDLDKIMGGGLPIGELTIIAGRPSAGKSAFMLNIAEYFAFNHKALQAAFFSLEMSKEALCLRLLSFVRGVSGTHIRKNIFTDDDRIKLIAELEKVSANIHIDDDYKINVTNIAVRATKLQKELSEKNKALGLIIIDYLQIMKGGDGYSTRTREMEDIVTALKDLSRKLLVPIVLISQLSRYADKPKLSDLKEKYIQEADNIIFIHIHRDSVNNPKSVTITVAKQKHGDTGEFELNFNPECVKFSNKD